MPEQAAPEATKWLKTQMDNRGWGIRETARKAGIAHPTISDILNLGEMPSFDTCKALANAFGMDPRVVLEEFGLLPKNPELTPNQQQLISWLPFMDEADQDEILTLARVKVERRKKVLRGKKATVGA